MSKQQSKVNLDPKKFDYDGCLAVKYGILKRAVMDYVAGRDADKDEQVKVQFASAKSYLERVDDPNFLKWANQMADENKRAKEMGLSELEYTAFCKITYEDYSYDELLTISKVNLVRRSQALKTLFEKGLVSPRKLVGIPQILLNKYEKDEVL